MSVRVDVQYAVPDDDLPSAAAFQSWAEAAVQAGDDMELVVRIVDAGESAALNASYRRKEGPTNVLSFPFEPPPQVESQLLGDVIICAPVVEREAREQGKPEISHWAHMLVHGILHLQGFDHRDADEAANMEGIETEILAQLGYGDPYE